jgi:hypothetical protein
MGRGHARQQSRCVPSPSARCDVLQAGRKQRAADDSSRRQQSQCASVRAGGCWQQMHADSTATAAPDTTTHSERISTVNHSTRVYPRVRHAAHSLPENCCHAAVQHWSGQARCFRGSCLTATADLHMHARDSRTWLHCVCVPDVPDSTTIVQQSACRRTLHYSEIMLQYRSQSSAKDCSQSLSTSSASPCSALIRLTISGPVRTTTNNHFRSGHDINAAAPTQHKNPMPVECLFFCSLLEKCKGAFISRHLG